MLENKRDLRFGKLMRELRLKKGYTITEFVRQLDYFVKDPYITHIELYGALPQPELIHKMAKLLQCNQKDLFKIVRKIKLDKYIRFLDKTYR